MMLLDMAEQYDESKITYLRELREKIVLQLGGKFDHKKIMSFLNKTGIVSIEDKEKCVYIGVSNEFVMSQVKKFFFKSIKEAVHDLYNSQYTAKVVVYAGFQKNNALLPDLKKLLHIKSKPPAFKDPIKQSLREELSSYFGILFDPNFRFDSFIAGGNSRMAFAAAKAVAENPGKIHNPLFLYGNVGLGKTHLMQAIGNEIIASQSEKVVLYLPTVNLIDEIVSGIRNDKFKKLQQKLNNVDILLLDDIQFLAGAEKTQEVFHHIFNDFYMKKKQIILSSDRPPKELVKITARLRSRFAL
ncbi:MAG: ATP-binding protein [bacterium]|nr:ATP-binding protein [bacterium]